MTSRINWTKMPGWRQRRFLAKMPDFAIFALYDRFDPWMHSSPERCKMPNLCEEHSYRLYLREPEEHNDESGN